MHKVGVGSMGWLVMHTGRIAQGWSRWARAEGRLVMHAGRISLEWG
jgi:hypothetical protein